jgi:hypothetical protein
VNACEDFRERLAAALRGRPGPPTPNVAWHEHLLGCARCRALLLSEEALEAVLASLPEPELPPRLAQRLLARLAPERAPTLEGLLELDRVRAAPGLPERVLAGLAEARASAVGERGLDLLLERVPAPAVPDGLAARVLAATRPAPARPRFAVLRAALPWTAGLAAAGLLGVLAWRAARPAREEIAPAPGLRSAANAPNAPNATRDAELLAALDVLERWDLLVDDDVALFLASVDPVEEELLDLAYDEDEDER